MTTKPPIHVNRPADALSDRMKKKFAAYVPRVRDPAEALPLTFVQRHDPAFKFPSMEPVRPGANDHLTVNRKGLRC